MHAVFKDGACRLLGGAFDVELATASEWLSDDPAAVRCEIYDDVRSIRGPLVALYERDAASGEWRRQRLAEIVAVPVRSARRRRA